MMLEMRLLCVVNKRACVFLRFAGSMLRIINSILSIRIRQRRGHTSAPLEPNSPGRLLTGSRKRGRKGRRSKVLSRRKRPSRDRLADCRSSSDEAKSDRS